MSHPLVGEGGLEPPHPFGHRNLNPARLPIPPLARVEDDRLAEARCRPASQNRNRGSHQPVASHG